MNEILRLAYELAKLGNSNYIACSEGYGPVWEKYNELVAAINTAAGVRVDAPYHCAPEDIDALLRWLDAINDPQQEALPGLENTDWRGRAGVIARVIRYLCGTRGVMEVPAGYERMRGGKPASHWRDNALEAAAQIAEAYHSHPGVAADIRAMKSTSGVATVDGGQR